MRSPKKVFFIGEALLTAAFLYASGLNLTKEWFALFGGCSIIWLVICGIGWGVNKGLKETGRFIDRLEYGPQDAQAITATEAADKAQEEALENWPFLLLFVLPVKIILPIGSTAIAAYYQLGSLEVTGLALVFLAAYSAFYFAIRSPRKA